MLQTVRLPILRYGVNVAFFVVIFLSLLPFMHFILLLAPSSPFSSVDGDQFKEHFTPFLCAAVTKGEFTIFKCFKHLYADAGKAQLVEEVLLDLHTRLVNNQPFPGTFFFFFFWFFFFCIYFGH
jgi:hypothetical protein